MTINTSLYTLDAQGVSLQGGVLGAGLPELNNIITDTSLKIHCKKVYIPTVISAFGNNSFTLPVVFGRDKCVLYVNGLGYFLDKDFTLLGSKITWINGSVSIDPLIDEVVCWGPANNYTAQAIEFGNIDVYSQLDEADGDFSNKPTIQLNNETDRYPFDVLSIFLFIDRKSYIPVTNYEYDEISKKIVYEIIGGITTSNEVSYVYFNKVETSPYLLGEGLYRTLLNVTSDNQSSIAVQAIPRKDIISSTNLFRFDDLGNADKRYTYYDDFIIQYPSVHTLNNLNTILEQDDVLDVSFIKDALAPASIGIRTIHLDHDTDILGEASLPLGKKYTYQLPSGPNFNINKAIVYFNGINEHQRVYDNYSNIETGTPARKPRTELTQTTMAYYSQPEAIDSLVPAESGDKFTIMIFEDVASISNIKIEYFKRDGAGLINGGPFTSVTLSQTPRGNKLIQFYNGEATFKQFNDIGITGNVINSFPYAPSGIDDLVYLYFTSDAYASLWKFDVIDTSSGDIANMIPMTVSRRIANLSASLLFVGGVLYPINTYEIVPGSGNKQIRTLSGTPVIPQNSKCILLHI